MTEELNLVALWQADLDILATQSPNWFVQLLPPRIIIKHGRFSPPRLPPAWLDNRPGAWTCWRYVIISNTLLDCPTACRRYVLSHEYGHLYARHHLRAMGVLLAAPWLMILLTVLARIVAGPTSPLAVSIGINLPLVVSIIASFGLLRPSDEYQADAFAVAMCGRQTVIDGMLWLSRASGRGLTRTLRQRLKRLGYEGK